MRCYLTPIWCLLCLCIYASKAYSAKLQGARICLSYDELPQPDDIVFFDKNGHEMHRIASKTQYRTFVRTGDLSFGSFVNGKSFTEAPMPKVIQSRGGVGTTDPIFQQHDYIIAAETFIFNENKRKGIVPLHTNGKLLPDPSTIPDLDPTLVKAIAMQETVLGTFDPNKLDYNDAITDIMQSNVYYSEKSHDWAESKKQFGLEKAKGVKNVQHSVKAGIGILYQKGLTGGHGEKWTGGKEWEHAVRHYNGGGVRNYHQSVLKMKREAKTPEHKNY
jgi:hypothetical protein